MDQEFAKKVKQQQKKKKVLGLLAVAIALLLVGSFWFAQSRGQGDGQGDLKPVTVEIRCNRLSENMELLKDPALAEYVPADGILLPEMEISISPGDSVFDVTDRACKEAGIQIEYEYTAAYDSHYIKGIGYLYEFSAGTYSGWLFYVDGKQPNYGCDKVALSGGEKIVWMYAVDYKTEDTSL